MSVVVSIENVGPCRKQLKVEVPQPAVEAETQRIVDEFRRQAKLPGFRKGKIPRDLVRQKYKEGIEKEVVERLVPRYWRQAEAESELQPLITPNIDEVDFQPGASLTFVASVDVRPEVEIGELAEFDLPTRDTEPTEEEIDQAIEEMRRAVADWVDVDRAAARGDLVEGDLLELTTEEMAEADPHQVRFEVGDPQVWEELTLEATGKKSGQAGEFEREVGEGDDKELRKYRLTVQTVKERDLPDLDADLAAKLGEFDSVEALREDVDERLRRSKMSELRRERERAVLDQLRERYPIALPQGVVDHEIEGMLRDYAQSLANSGVDLESQDLDWQAMGEQVRPQAENRVHARLLLDAIAERRQLKVDEADFEKALASIAGAQRRSTVSVRQELDRHGRLGELREQMKREKALKGLLGEDLETSPSENDSTENEL